MNFSDLVQRFTIVVGDYVVRVRAHNYSYPNSIFANSSCCNHPCGESSCDNIFHYCLRSLGTRDGQLHCNDENFVNYDDEPLNFSKPIALGLLNPLSIQGPWTVSQNNGTRVHTYTTRAVHDFAIVVY